MIEQSDSLPGLASPTRWAPILKEGQIAAVAPNLTDYVRERSQFSWEVARGWLQGLPGGRGLNIAHEAVDRHAAGPLGNRLAMRWISRTDARRDYTYADLCLATNRFANVLRRLGIGKGDVVATLAGRIPGLYVAALGTLKNGSVYTPLYSAFGPDPIVSRMTIARARVLVTTDVLYRKKVQPVRAQMPALEHVLLVRETTAALPPATLDFDDLIAGANDDFVIPPTDPQDLALLHFTSGTTGKPKGAMHVHEAVVAHYATARFALDFHPADRFWCTADPGWVTGTSYGIIAPLTHGLTMVVDEADFDAERWYRIIRDEQVSVWYTAPTAIRMLMKAGTPLARQYDLRSLRFLGSVGEPLNPEGVVWGVDAFDHPFHDNWWQTETGGIMIANFASMDIRPGSMGRPLPGVEAAIVRRTPDGAVAIDEPGIQGELALRPGWPSMFRGYLGEEERYRKCFRGGFYLTGDLARRDADGYYWFVGRADDVIKSSGHLIGPFEVESALLEHQAVAAAGVIGKPDPVAGEIVKAFVTLKPGFEPGETLRRSIQAHARTRLGAVVAPKEIAFVPTIPLTRSGKIMRRLLKARELGLPEGDTSTLEPSWTTTQAETDHSRHLLREMLRIRRFEEKCAELYSAGKIRGFLHLYIGEEAVAVGVMQALGVDDAIVATYREHGHALARGVRADALMAEMFGKQEGCSRGRGGSMHVFDAATRFYGGNAIVAGGLPVAVGLALADNYLARQRVTACFFGDGAVAEGEFHESMNLAALWKLPVLFLCENNLYAMGTRIERALAQPDLPAKARTYGMTAESVDGMDVLAVERAARIAVAHVKTTATPYFLEARTYRFRAHSMFDAELYRDKAEVEEWKTRDPLAVLRRDTGIGDSDCASLDAEVLSEIAGAVAFAESGTWEPLDQLTRDVYTSPQEGNRERLAS